MSCRRRNTRRILRLTCHASTRLLYEGCRVSLHRLDDRLSGSLVRLRLLWNSDSAKWVIAKVDEQRIRLLHDRPYLGNRLPRDEQYVGKLPFGDHRAKALSVYPIADKYKNCV